MEKEVSLLLEGPHSLWAESLLDQICERGERWPPTLTFRVRGRLWEDTTRAELLQLLKNVMGESEYFRSFLQSCQLFSTEMRPGLEMYVAVRNVNGRVYSLPQADRSARDDGVKATAGSDTLA